MHGYAGTHMGDKQLMEEWPGQGAGTWKSCGRRYASAIKLLVPAAATAALL